MTIDEAILGALEEGASAAPYAVTITPEVLLALVHEVRAGREVPADAGEEAARMEEIRGRIAKATPGLWGHDGAEVWASQDLDCDGEPNSSYDLLWVADDPHDPDQPERDAALIANAPDDLAFLLDAYARQANLVRILRQDGTPAQDQARREAKAWCVAWLRGRAESAVSPSSLRALANALEKEDGP